MKVIIVFRGLLTERIIVKAYAESTTLENGQVDIWEESKVGSACQFDSNVIVGSKFFDLMIQSGDFISPYII